MSHKYRTSLVLLVVSLHVLLTTTSTVYNFTLSSAKNHNNDTTNNQYSIDSHFETPAYSFGNVLFNITTELALAGNGCGPSLHEAGKISVVERHSFDCTLLTKARSAEIAGAVGIIFRALANKTYIAQDSRSPVGGTVGIPVVVVSVNDFNDIRNALINGTELLVTLVPGKNDFLLLVSTPGFIIGQIILCLLSFGCFCLFLYKLTMFIKYQGLQLNVSQVFLCLALVASLLTVFLALDISYSRGFFVADFIHSVPWLILPLTILCTFLITLFWLEAITVSSKETKISPFLSDHTALFLVVSFIYFLSSIAVAAVIALENTEKASSISAGFGSLNIIGIIIFIIFYIYVAVKVQVALGAIKGKIAKRLWRIRLRVIITVATLVFYFIITVTFLSLSKEVEWAFTSHAALMIVLLNQGIAIDPTLLKKVSSTGGGKKSDVNDTSSKAGNNPPSTRTPRATTNETSYINDTP